MSLTNAAILILHDYANARLGRTITYGGNAFSSPSVVGGLEGAAFRRMLELSDEDAAVIRDLLRNAGFTFSHRERWFRYSFSHRAGGRHVP